MQDDAGNAVEIRGGQVACWLADRFNERPCWLDSELALAAHQGGVDLAAWRHSPAVVALGIVVEDVWVPWANRMLPMVRRGATAEEMAVDANPEPVAIYEDQ